MLDTSVKFFESAQAGAPTSTGQVGSLIGLLDACLVNGFGQVTVATLSVASDVATLTVSTGHGFTMVGNVGPVILIAGAEPAALNGEWRVASVTNTTTLTFATSEIADCTATGTITVKRAPAGWEKRYSGTNKAVYARTALDASPALIRVQDNGVSPSTAYTALIALYETMSDVDTGTNSTASSLRYIHHSNAANSTPMAWRLIANDKMAYLFIDQNVWKTAAAFGDLNSYKAGDLYSCVLNASNSAGATSPPIFYSLLSSSLMLRSYTGAAGVITVGGSSHSKSNAFSNAPQPYPSPVDNNFHAWPVEMWETAANVARGMLPGLWNPIHSQSSIPQGTIITDIPQLMGRTLFCQSVSGTNQFVCAIDITGPWT
ncbi:hypothetical protein HUU62_08625 [Rhodoferax sp. 4810]|uniref:Uncharacterized protein n=1 Tax=Thiospirillum jenense TaxID=1653858 RepID=A0A839H7E8_9GAMM|nr:hypothetical protein [Thiospirillum jenense]MBB1074473.1 hypothetical protein [Rhodoferax jenense]MBB1125545.1 hypothetical protein [Thiospirillum jenense]